MVELKGTSWQQRYGSSLIYTLRCKIEDKPGTSAKLIEAFGKVNAHMGDIILVDIQGKYKIRDFTIHISEKKQIEDITKLIDSINGIELISTRDDILETHRRGSIDVVSRAALRTLTDLRMVYTPGVASVCKKIEAEPDTAWQWTGICDRVAVVTNGTAVLGLGDIGVLPSLPVMEGKASIFAEFAQISAFPILVDTKDVDTFVETVVNIAPTFGAIQLEDVSAPSCFEIEDKLKERLNIPVFHDDQHGTATVCLASIINALKQTGKTAPDCSVIMLGAGSAGIAISKILLGFGIGDIVVYDSAGAIYRGREEKMNPYKKKLAQITNKDNQKCELKEGFEGKDIFIGVSQPNTVTKSMISSMAKDPIVLPLSNPIGEITKEEATEAGAAITADGRDINNALAYPGIFRGALDAHATDINMDMKLAAANKLAELADEGQLLPDILDKSVHRRVADAVADAWKAAR